ncbi:Helicase, C-terminal [Dillenia turbinata]|uniref:RNA helicase n=1 Tax=Dillenia turbinata TaxID=194707 RepID=A0AAN8VWN7_9MAGN
MGRKLETAQRQNESEIEDTQTNHINKGSKKLNKKKKNHNHDHEEEEEEYGKQHQPKRKLEHDSPESRKKKKEKEKYKHTKDNESPTNDLEFDVKKKHKGERLEKESNGTDEEVTKNGEIVVTGNEINDSKYAALSSFSDSGLPWEVLECCKGFQRPSPIQSRAWPFLLNGRDFIGIAATGSGKTLAFGVPAIMHIMRERKKKVAKKVNPLCLVLSPTRELAQQISDVLHDAGKPCGVKSVCLYGGTSKGPQISALKSGVDIVIGTPGRLKDLIEMGVCCLKEVSFVVLDEADRMLDMGFEQEVRSILSQTSSARQMVMFSATWPLLVHQLAQEYMDPNPVKVVVGSEDLAANHDVMQIVEVLDDRSRDQRLVSLLEKYHKSQRNRVLVFVLYKKEAVRVENMLQRRGWKVVSIHGDKAQHARTQALSLFKDGSCPLLGLAGELVNVLREAGQVVPDSLLKFGTHVKKKESKIYGAHFKEIAIDAPKSTKITFDDSDED